MPTFSYTAIEARSGREMAGVVEGVNREQASATLKARGLAPVSLTAAGAVGATGRAEGGKKGVTGETGVTKRGRGESGLKPALRRRRTRSFVIGRVVNAKGLMMFTRQLSTLVRAGMPLVRSLDVLARQERNEAFRAVIAGLAETIRSGGSFSDGLLRYPKIFDRLYVNLVKAGEAGGALDAVLERLAHFMEKAERVKGKVKAALTYPAIVMLLAVGIVAALMIFVVPRFEQIFAGMLKGQALPALTQLVLNVSRFVQEHVMVSIAGLVGAYIAFGVFRKTKAGERVMDRVALRVPVLGDLVLKAAVARFTRTFGTLLKSGVPILPALLITRDTSGNVPVADAIEAVHEGVREGGGVARPLEATEVFPGMVTSMIDVGEETGALPEMLVKIADVYDEEVDQAVAGLTTVIEPLMIVLLAGVVGTIVIALFLPIVSIIQHLQ